MRKTRVYIAGPYSKGNIHDNVARAIDVATILLDRGYVPYVPHLMHFWHLQNPKDYHTWLTLGLEYLTVCDVVLRLDGESSGADIEISNAKFNNLEVYYSLDTLCACEPIWKGDDSNANNRREAV